MCSIAAMTAYMRYTLLVYIAFQRIDEKHDSKLGERRCSFTLKESLLRVRCAGSQAVLISSTLLDCYWWDILHCVVVVPDRKIFHTAVVRKISLCPPHHNVWSRKSLANMVKENAVTTGPGRCLLIVLLVSFGQGFHHGAQHLDRPL